MARATKPGGSRKDNKPAAAPQGKTKAQEELDRFRARSAAAAAPGAASPSPFPTMMPWMMPAGPGGAPGWALPPSVMPYPGMPSMPTLPTMPGFPTMPSMPTGGAGIGDQVGSTLGLGMNVVNQLLAGSLRLLQGLAGAGYGYAPAAWGGGHGHHGCGCGCGGGCGCDSCGSDCCGPDCCDVMGVGGCCRPSVGNCC